MSENALSRRSNGVKWVLGVIFTWQALAIAQTLVPDWGLMAKTMVWIKGDGITDEEKETVARLDRLAAPQPPGRPLDSLFFQWRVLTGTRQDWQMFHTSPRDANLEIRLEAKDSTGKVHILSPGLPGFVPNDVLEDGRFYHFWARAEYWNEQEYINSYLENVARLLEQSEDPYFQDVTLIYTKHLLLNKDKIAEDGEMAKAVEREWWLPRDAWPK